MRMRGGDEHEGVRAASGTGRATGQRKSGALGRPIETPARRDAGRAGVPRHETRGEPPSSATGRRRARRGQTGAPPASAGGRSPTPLELLQAYFAEREDQLRRERLARCDAESGRHSEAITLSLSAELGELVDELRAVAEATGGHPARPEMLRELMGKIDRQSSVLFARVMYALDVSARRPAGVVEGTAR